MATCSAAARTASAPLNCESKLPKQLLPLSEPPGHHVLRTPVLNQVAQAEAGGEEGGAAGGSRTLPPARAGGAARATHEGPAVRGRQTVPVHRARGIPLLRPGDPGDPGDLPGPKTPKRLLPPAATFPEINNSSGLNWTVWTLDAL